MLIRVRFLYGMANKRLLSGGSSISFLPCWNEAALTTPSRSNMFGLRLRFGRWVARRLRLPCEVTSTLELIDIGAARVLLS